MYVYKTLAALRRWRKAGFRTRTRQCRIERLEELLLMSAQTWSDAQSSGDASYQQWRTEIFQIGQLDSPQVYVDSWGTAGELESFANLSSSLIGSNLVRQQYGYTGAGYSIAVIDTGVDYKHPDLAANYLGGWDFVDDDADPMDLNGHGTHVAGIIAGTNSQHIGIATQVKIISLRVLGANGTGTYGDVEDALRWVAKHRQEYNIAAVNLSLGAGNFTSNPWNFLEEECQQLVSQGVFIAAASGNQFFAYGSQQGLGYPAISPWTVSVGAVWDADYGTVKWGGGAIDQVTGKDKITSFTQRSSQLDILAPGAFITSTYLRNSYATLAGTSMASPIVAAAAVIIHQALDARGLAKNASQQEILSIMRATGVTVVDGDDEVDNVQNTGLTFKRLDLAAAIHKVFEMDSGEDKPNDNRDPQNPPPRPTSPDEEFVKELFRDLFRREAKEAGINFCIGALRSGMSKAQLVDLLSNTDEHRIIQIQRQFENLLGRNPTSQELEGLVPAFRKGYSEAALTRAILVGAEYSSQCPQNNSFISTVYQDLFNREPLSAGKWYWNNFLNQGGTREQMVDQLLNTSERYQKLVADYFQEYLGRPPLAGGKAYLTNQLLCGQITTEGLEQLLLVSTEYYSRVAARAGSLGLSSEDFLRGVGFASGNSANEMHVAWFTNSGIRTTESLGTDSFSRVFVDGNATNDEKPTKSQEYLGVVIHEEQEIDRLDEDFLTDVGRRWKTLCTERSTEDNSEVVSEVLEGDSLEDISKDWLNRKEYDLALSN